MSRMCWALPNQLRILNKVLTFPEEEGILPAEWLCPLTSALICLQPTSTHGNAELVCIII